MPASMTYLVSVILLSLLAEPPGPSNPDFETGEVGGPDAGWFLPPAIAESYEARFVEDEPHRGQRCALITNRGVPKPNHFGNLMQSFDAKPFRGQRVRFRAYVRTELDDPGCAARLWMRVDRSEGKMGFFDNMGDRPIRASTWTRYTISGPIADDARAISVGCMLTGTGKVWLDAASFEVVGKAGAGLEKPRPLTRRGLENLVAYTRLLGYVRHFHPSDGAAATDWDDFAIRGIRVVEKPATARSLAAALEELFRPIAPTVRVFPTGQPPRLSAEHTRPADGSGIRVVRWRHLGFGHRGDAARQVYKSDRDYEALPDTGLPEHFADPAKPFAADLGGGVSCLIPLTLYADEQGTLPHAGEADALPPNPADFSASGDDRATRLADVALIWNILQHFYPYFDVVRTDWPAALRDALDSAATDKDADAFNVTLRRLIARLHDGHGAVLGPGETGMASAPILCAYVENALVVTVMGPKYRGRIKPGDRILAVDGRPADRALRETEELISGATPQWIRFNACRRLLVGPVGSTLAVKVQPRSGSEFTETLERTSAEAMPTEKRPEAISEIKPGVMYVDLDRITDDDFSRAMPRLRKATGIVFDLRGYPRRVSPGAIIGHFIDKQITCPQWHIPMVSRPDHVEMEFQFSNWPVEPARPRLKARVAYITDGRAISYAETWMGMIDHYKLAAIVGDPTAGTNGNVNPVQLPGGYSVMWTGMKVLRHDGTQHHGIGVRPTIPVSRTIDGIAAGRDELLERAVREVTVQ